jgi:hypothetical protein
MVKKLCNSSVTQAKPPQQLCLFLETAQQPQKVAFQKRQKPQIVSVPGVSPKERNRYQVRLDNQILGDRLALDEALALAKRGNRS